MLLEGDPHIELQTIDSGARAAGASEESMWGDVERVLAAYQAQDQVELVARLEQGTAKSSGVARGLEPVLDALVRGEVERLVLDLQAVRELTVDPSEHPGLALPEAALSAEKLPADEVLIAAAARTGADLTLLPRNLSHGGGVAATLRWDQ